MSARFLVTDALSGLRSLPDDSVDMVLTSPPFLALRSYLPPDHPEKHLEVGAELTPGAYLDTLLAVVTECRRVLAPTGSMVFELGDTYAGSGGAGGDYSHGGNRDGQQRFDGSASKAYGTGAAVRPPRSNRPKYREGYTRKDSRENRLPDRAHDELEGITPTRLRTRRQLDGWPLDKSLCLIPESFRWMLAYGRNPFTGAELEPWRIRNVIRWCRNNPPVGALGDKFRPATSDLVVACTGRKRYFDLDAVRKPNATPDNHAGRERARLGIPAKVGASDTEVVGPNNERGTPPNDHGWFDEEWEDENGDVFHQDAWLVNSVPYKGKHHAVWPPQLLVTPILAMCPPGGVVLDPFAGSGTTLQVATGHGRNAIGIDLDERNVALAERRCGMFLEVESLPSAVGCP